MMHLKPFSSHQGAGPGQGIWLPDKHLQGIRETHAGAVEVKRKLEDGTRGDAPPDAHLVGDLVLPVQCQAVLRELEDGDITIVVRGNVRRLSVGDESDRGEKERGGGIRNRIRAGRGEIVISYTSYFLPPSPFSPPSSLSSCPPVSLT